MHPEEFKENIIHFLSCLFNISITHLETLNLSFRLCRVGKYAGLKYLKVKGCVV